jgi:hypothetical protein
MSQKISQSIINQKCDLLKSQNEEITISKISRLVGAGVSIIDVVDKVTLYKESRKNAVDIASKEDFIIPTIKKDELLEIFTTILKDNDIDKSDLVFKLRNESAKYIYKRIDDAVQKIKGEKAAISNKNDSLEISNLTISKRYNNLLEKYKSLKEENYIVKQNYNTKSIKYMEQEELDKTLLSWDDFKSHKDQLASLSSYGKVAVYDKAGLIVIKFPATDFLTQECRAGNSRYLKAKTVYDYGLQAWVLSGFVDILTTLSFLKRNRFVISKELETVAKYRNKS